MFEGQVQLYIKQLLERSIASTGNRIILGWIDLLGSSGKHRYTNMLKRIEQYGVSINKECR